MGDIEPHEEVERIKLRDEVLSTFTNQFRPRAGLDHLVNIESGVLLLQTSFLNVALLVEARFAFFGSCEFC